MVRKPIFTIKRQRMKKSEEESEGGELHEDRCEGDEVILTNQFPGFVAFLKIADIVSEVHDGPNSIKPAKAKSKGTEKLPDEIAVE